MAFPILLFLFVVMPLLELALLLKVGEFLGLWPTVGLVVVTGVVGATLARFEGLRVLLNVRKELDEGRLPAPYLLDGVMILIAAALLVTPGIITDAVGFCLLIPAFRSILKGWLRRKMEQKLHAGSIDVTYTEL